MHGTQRTEAQFSECKAPNGLQKVDGSQEWAMVCLSPKLEHSACGVENQMQTRLGVTGWFVVCWVLATLSAATQTATQT